MIHDFISGGVISAITEISPTFSDKGASGADGGRAGPGGAADLLAAAVGPAGQDLPEGARRPPQVRGRHQHRRDLAHPRRNHVRRRLGILQDEGACVHVNLFSS